MLQYLKNWAAPAPRPKQPPIAGAQEVTPPDRVGGEDGAFTALVFRPDRIEVDLIDPDGAPDEDDPELHPDPTADDPPFADREKPWGGD